MAARYRIGPAKSFDRTARREASQLRSTGQTYDRQVAALGVTHRETYKSTGAAGLRAPAPDLKRVGLASVDVRWSPTTVERPAVTSHAPTVSPTAVATAHVKLERAKAAVRRQELAKRMEHARAIGGTHRAGGGMDEQPRDDQGRWTK